MTTLDLKSQQLYNEIIEHAERIRRANPYLYRDIENIAPYDGLGPRIKDGEIRKKFYDLFDRLLKTHHAFLIEMRDTAWELRKTKRNPDTPDLKESSPYFFINGVIRYKERDPLAS